MRSAADFGSRLQRNSHFNPGPLIAEPYLLSIAGKVNQETSETPSFETLNFAHLRAARFILKPLDFEAATLPALGPVLARRAKQGTSKPLNPFL